MNEYAARLHSENDAMNKVDALVEVVNGDAADLPGITKKKFDRVIMPLPSEANRFLPTALAMAKKGGTIHYYRHVLGVDEVDAKASLREELRELLPQRVAFATRKVREVGPRWIEMMAEIRAPG